MNIDLLLYIVLFSQIMFLSYYYPRRMLIRIHTIFENYPPNEFPKLYPESIEKYKKSTASDPYSSEAYYHIGFTFALLKKYKKAIDPLKKAIELKKLKQ